MRWRGWFYRLLVSEGGVESVGDGVGLLQDYGVYDAIPQLLQREPDAEDDVVGAPVTHSVPSALRTRRASRSHLTLNS